MVEVVCAECGNTWNPSAVSYRKYHGKCQICGSRHRASVNIGVESIRKSGGILLTGDVILDSDNTMSLSQLEQIISMGVNGLSGQKTISISADEFGRPNINPPTVVDEDNVTLYEFTVNTDSMTYKFPIPSDYLSGDLIFFIIWTNDGGVDDNGKNVRWQLDYQIVNAGESISGSHANSPKAVTDTYASESGFIEHHTPIMTIDEADFDGKFCIYLKLSAVTAPATVLTCAPNLIGICLSYASKINNLE